MRIMILNGPNLNMLGIREPHIYGSTTLDAIKQACEEFATFAGAELSFHQSNHEGELVDWIQEARTKGCGVILNAGAYTHTSVALLDACRALNHPLIEVHLSNPYKREDYRRRSFIAEAADALICGLGANGYVVAVDALAELLKEEKE